MFNNCNSKTNGEKLFFDNIKNNIQIIFDVGCSYDTELINFKGIVHYFDPNKDFVEKLKQIPNKNRLSFFNIFGLGDDNKKLYYYPKYQSFYDRIKSCKISDEVNKVEYKIMKSYDYINKHNIQNIDFLKIDTEGFEFEVIKGFREHIKRVKIIQFEYGGSFLDSKVKLIDVINYLKENGFGKFSYLTNKGSISIVDFKDHYQYCNIICNNIEQ